LKLRYEVLGSTKVEKHLIYESLLFNAIFSLFSDEAIDRSDLLFLSPSFRTTRSSHAILPDTPHHTQTHLLPKKTKQNKKTVLESHNGYYL
jgi:hypothetical protein